VPHLQADGQKAVESATEHITTEHIAIALYVTA